MPSTVAPKAPVTLELPPRLTLDTLAERSGISANTLRAYFWRGKQPPTLTRLRLAAALRAYAREIEATADRFEGEMEG